MAGTKYLTKNALINSVVAKIFTNSSFLVTAAQEQKALLDMIESLWDRASGYTTLSYSDLMDLVNTSSLSPGEKYAFEYQCIHQIPGTTENNIDSTEYVEKLETFVIEAIDESTLSGQVFSIDHPKDFILFDSTNNTSEVDGVIRTGRVDYRHDLENNLSTWYDFRGVYLRRGSFSPGAIPEWTSGNDYDKEDVTYTGTLPKASMTDQLANTNYSNFWLAIGSQLNFKWLWEDSSAIYKTTFSRTATEDKLTFTGFCENISIGKSNVYSGYNNIVFFNCKNIKLGDGSYNSSFETCENINITQLINSYFGISYFINADTITTSSLYGCKQLTFSDLTTSVFEYSDEEGVTFGSGAKGILGRFMKSGTIGSKCVDNSFRYFANASIGDNHFNNVYINIEITSFAGGGNNNVISGVRYCTFGERLRNCNFVANQNQYAVYQNVHVGNNCSYLNSTLATVITQVSFGEGCNDISLDSGASITNSMIGKGCSSWTLTNNSTIADSYIGSKMQNLTMTNGSEIRNSQIGNECLNYTLTAGDITDSTIENNVDEVEITNGFILESVIGNKASNLTISNSTMRTTTLGNSFLNLTLTNSALTSTDIGENCSSFSIIETSEINNSVIGSEVNVLELDSASHLYYSTIETKCFQTVLTNGAYIKDGLIKSNCIALTFNGVSGIEFEGFEIVPYTNNKEYRNDGASPSPHDVKIVDITIGNLEVSPNTIMFNLITNTDGSTLLYFDQFDFKSEFDSNTVIVLNNVPENKPFRLILSNTDVASHDINFGSNVVGFSAPTLSVGANLEIEYELKMTTNKKLVVLRQTTL